MINDAEMNKIHTDHIFPFFMVCSMAGLKVELRPIPTMNGYVCICKDNKGNRLWDVACHDGTYGNREGLLEGFQGPFATELDDVAGWLTCEQALEMVETYIQNS